MGKLTEVEVRAAKATDRDLQIGDGNGLVLRVGRGSGEKSFWYRYKLGNTSKWVSLGRYPALSLKDARLAAATIDIKRRQGIDPLEERAADERRRLAEEELRRQTLANEAARLTVIELFEKWEKLELSGRKDKGAEVRRCFEKDVFPALGHLAAENVTRAMIATTLDKVVERDARIVARNLLGDLRQMYGYAIKRGFVEHDPTSHLKRDDFGRKVERDRVLTDSEIKLLVQKLPKADMWDSSVWSIWIMLSTCCRVGEITQARIDDLDLELGEWPFGYTQLSADTRYTGLHLYTFAIL